jgi:predicted nucleotidyltransferase
MNIPITLSPEKHALLESLTGQLSATPGVKAVVLGGSYARGTQHAGSDLDIGVYYSDAASFAIDDIRRIAAQTAGKLATVTDKQPARRLAGSRRPGGQPVQTYV